MKSQLVNILLITIASLSIANAQSTKPGDNKPGKDDKALNPIIQKAVDELGKEMQGVLKDPQKATRREKCDYFAKSTETVPESDLVAALEQRLNKHVIIDTYIKWQLLSIHKEIFSQTAAKQVLQLYRRSPLPPLHPGATGEEQREMNQLIATVKPEETDIMDQRNKEWQDKLSAHFKGYGPMLAYREELYSRLPKSVELIRAGFDDADSRITNGYESDNFIKKIGGDLRGLASEMKPVEIGPFVTLLQRLSGRDGPNYYAKIYVTSKNTVAWQKDRHPPQWAKKFCDQLASDLTSMAKAGG